MASFRRANQQSQKLHFFNDPNHDLYQNHQPPKNTLTENSAFRRSTPSLTTATHLGGSIWGVSTGYCGYCVDVYDSNRLSWQLGFAFTRSLWEKKHV